MQEKLLALIEQARSEIHALADSLSEAERKEPGTPEHWTAKDTVGHLIEWAQRFSIRLSGVDQPDFEDGAEVDTENARIYAIYHPLSWEEILAIVDRAYATSTGQVENFSEDELAALDPSNPQANRALWRAIVGNFYTHPIMHLCYAYREKGDVENLLRLNEASAKQLLELDSEPSWQGTALYNMACNYALVGEKTRAISFLTQALHLAPSLIDWSKQDGDLESLRGEPEFEAIYAQQ